MNFNKKGAGDVASFVFALLAFGLILSGALSLSTLFMGDRDVNIPDNFTTLQSMVDENSELGLHLDAYGNELTLNETKTLTDRFEDTLLGKAFKSVSLLTNSFKVVGEFSGTLGGMLGIPSWMKIYILAFFGVMLLVLTAYFFRGIQR